MNNISKLKNFKNNIQIKLGGDGDKIIQNSGNSIKTLIEIAEGKHSFCQKLIKAKKPFLIVGSSLKKRVDAASLDTLIVKLSKYTKIIDENWFGINFLPLTANKVGEFLLGVDTKNKQNLNKIKYLYSYCVSI